MDLSACHESRGSRPERRFALLMACSPRALGCLREWLDRERVAVLLELLGRKVRVVMDEDALVAV